MEVLGPGVGLPCMALKHLYIMMVSGASYEEKI